MSNFFLIPKRKDGDSETDDDYCCNACGDEFYFAWFMNPDDKEDGIPFCSNFQCKNFGLLQVSRGILADVMGISRKLMMKLRGIKEEQ